MINEKPNIILLMADQLMPSKIGAYGCDYAITPNIDKLIKEGVKFDTAYTSCPICAPARMSLLTGKYISRIDCFDNSAVLKADEPCFTHYLSYEGYDTVLTGKMHMVGPDQLHGYEKRLQTNVYPANFHWLTHRKEGQSFKDLHPKPIAIDYLGENTGPRQWSMEIDYDEETVFLAKKYLATKCTIPSGTAQKPLPNRDDRPFFLTISLNHPHEPFHNKQKFWDMYEDIDIPIPEYPEELIQTYSSMDKELADFHGSQLIDLKNPRSLMKLHRAYMASVTYFDSKVGEIMETMEDFGLMDNTIIIFTSDHGDMLGYRGMVQKRRFYDYSSRIPLSITFPKQYMVAKSGLEKKDPVSICDIFPTILELAGAKKWLTVDGESLIPNIYGKNDPERPIFCEQHSEGVTMSNFMVRKGDYKFNYLGKGDCQLFNMKEDPEEWNNLADDPVYKSLKEELEALILSNFDPEQIDINAEESIEKRWIIRQAHDAGTGPSWNYEPNQNVDHVYWRSEE